MLKEARRTTDVLGGGERRCSKTGGGPFFAPKSKPLKEDVLPFYPNRKAEGPNRLIVRRPGIQPGFNFILAALSLLVRGREDHTTLKKEAEGYLPRYHSLETQGSEGKTEEALSCFNTALS